MFNNMEKTFPASRSSIPKANFRAKTIRRSVSVPELPSSCLQTPSERYFPGQNNAGICGAEVTKKNTFQKPLTDGNGLRSWTNTLAELPIIATRDDASGRKRPAAEPISNQSSKAKIPAWDTKALLKQAEEDLAKVNERVSELTVMISDQEHHLASLMVGKNSLDAELRKKNDDLDSANLFLNERKEKIAKLQVKYANLCSECEDLNEKLVLMVRYNAKAKLYAEAAAALSERKTSLEFYNEECARLKEQIIAQNIKRRFLHNKVMDLKGTIRVFCRVRPLLAAELAKQTTIDHLIFVDKTSLEVVKGSKKTKSLFSFDRVFPPTTPQMDIFEQLAELVQSLIDGYNVCVFAYGQTGSGKTYTMEGGLGYEERGMIPRSIEHIFTALENSPITGWKYKMDTSFLEIYNEQVRDLLETGLEKKSCEIRNPATSGSDMVVTNLRVQSVSSAAEVYSLLNVARRNRAVAATVHNDYSSRSHFVFKLRLHGENENTGKKIDAVLNFVDLAGSEKLVEVSENTRVAETKNINRSLSNLGNVILALAHKNEHVPYRNSKLTHLLQTCLGGNSKTLMLVNLSPKEDAIEETLNSLRFAKCVNECYVGRAQRNIN